MLVLNARLEDLQEAETSHSLALVRTLAVACKRYTVNEVLAELDGSDFEESEEGIWT